MSFKVDDSDYNHTESNGLAKDIRMAVKRLKNICKEEGRHIWLQCKILDPKTTKLIGYQNKCVRCDVTKKDWLHE